MKRTVSIIIAAIVSTCAFAQIQHKTVFDLTQPSKLTPTVDPSKEDKGEINVSQMTFSKDFVKVGFSSGLGIGPAIQTSIDEDTKETSYALRIYSQEGLVVSVPSTCDIECVEFTDNSIVGDLRVLDEFLGEQVGEDEYVVYGEQSNGYKVWTNKHGKQIDRLVYRLSSAPSKINKIEVTYTAPSAVLVPETSIADNSTVQSFDSLVLTFLSDIKIKDASKITISHNIEDTETQPLAEPLTATVKDCVATLKPSAPIAKDGKYAITIPEKSFVDKDGFENKEIKITFTVKTAFNYVSVEPTPGIVQSIPLTISVDYGAMVGGIDDDKNIRLYKDGVPYKPVKAKVSDENDHLVVFEIQNITKPIVEKGLYSLRVPEGTIFNEWKGDSEYEKANPTLDIVYTVDEPLYVQDARKLLDNAGVGYPTKESDAYKNLETLLNAETLATEAEVAAAVEAYYNEQVISMPENGKWYQIAAVNAEGKNIYLASVDGETLFVEDADGATEFEVVDSADGYVMRNNEGMYLTVQGVAEENAEASKLTLAKLDAANLKLEDGATCDASDVLALFSIYGECKNAAEELVNVYALVNFDENQLKTDASVSDAYFKNSISSAFKFTEVEKPVAPIETVETAYTLTPEIAESSADKLTITFTEVSDVQIAKDADPYFADKSDNRIENVKVELKLVEGTTNAFTIALTGLSESEYQLVLPEGTFIYAKDDVMVKTKEIKESFFIGKTGSVDDEGINFTYSIFQIAPTTSTPIKDVDLNNILITNYGSPYPGLVANPKVKVRLTVYDTNATVLVGYIKSYDDVNNLGVPTLKVVFEKEIKEGDLKSDQYALVLEKGCFGDNNYGKYLNDRTSVNANECHANDRFVVPFVVNNAIANSIDNIKDSDNKSGDIYNMFGVKVDNISAPGIYIINGKKVIVR